MTLPSCLVALGLFLGIHSAPDSPVKLADVHVSGLHATASRAQVHELLGKPLRVVEPRYECGEYSSEQMGQKFYQLRYRQAIFIGNAQQGYELESFTFAPTGPARLACGRYQLSAATTLTEFARLFGKLETHTNKDGSVAVVVWQQDASAIFTFRAGHLVSYDYHGTGC